ncbi:MAG: PQQ-binding-like beta-propeller repeat protein [Actinomycetota bacterium]
MLRPLPLLAACAALGAVQAAADDWPQFRRDERRTAASKDRLTLPLTDVWSAPSGGLVVWKGRAFYMGADGRSSAVVCADMRTGATLWRQRLVKSSRTVEPLNEQNPLAVSADGVVFAPDSTPGSVLRAFRATDGAPLATYSSAVDGRATPQVVLFDAAPGQRVVPVQSRPSNHGAFLVRGNEAVPATLADAFVRWTPGTPPSITSFAHLAPQLSGDPHPVIALLGGFPPAQVGSHLVIGGMTALGLGDRPHKQMLGVFDGHNCLWHRDYGWSLGIPSVEQDLIFTGAGGISATRAILAHDARTGAVRWTFAPGGLPPDAVGTMSAVVGSGGRFRSFGGPMSDAAPNAFRVNPGLVVTGRRVYGQVGAAVAALDAKTGAPIWAHSLAPRDSVTSVVATPEHLLVALRSPARREDPDRLLVLSLDSGKLNWNVAAPPATGLALSNGLLYMSGRGRTLALGPAERTFRLAIDSPRKADYDPSAGQPPAEREEPNEPQPGAAEEQPAAPVRALADASVLRLQWGEPLPELLRKARERRAATPGMPLLLSLDWLDSRRASIRGGNPWDARQIGAFASACGALAAEVTPEHFDLAPEANVWAARDPSRLETLRQLLRAAKQAVQQSSPETKTLMSFNVEVLRRTYGRGSLRPFGELTLPQDEVEAQLRLLLPEVDELGLASTPQAGFRTPEEIPGDYLLGLKRILPQKPIVVTRLTVHADATTRTGELQEAAFLKRLIQTAYWLDAPMVAYPDAVPANRPVAGAAPGAEERPNLAQEVWRTTLAWKRVTRLSAPAADLDKIPM